MGDIFKYCKDEIEEVTKCPWCFSGDWTSWSDFFENFPPVKCNDCGVVFLQKRLNEKGRKRFYQNYVQLHETPDRLALRLKMYEIEYKLISRIVPQGNVLDVGCGSGKFLSNFATQRYKRFGIEYGREALEKACQLIDREFIFEGGLLDAPLAEDNFDLIIFRGVLEHLPNPRQVLDKAYILAKKGGYIFLTSMPNLECLCAELYKTKWTQHREFEHIIHFGKTHFRRFFEEKGFQEIMDNDLYWDTPYAKPQEDILEVAEVIKRKHEGATCVTKTSPAFWGNILSMAFKKEL